MHRKSVGCGISKMVSLKKQDFWPRINILKGFFFTKSIDELWFIKKCQNLFSKVNFRCQKSIEFFQKKKNLRISI